MSEETVSPDPAPGTCRTFRLAGVDMRFRFIPAGRFRMGHRGMGEQHPWCFSEEPPHEVEIERGFWLGETPVTRAQYAAIKMKTPAQKGGKGERLNSGDTDASDGQGDDLPVVDVSWDDAHDMCGWLSRNGMERPEGCSPEEWEFRLPSEAEWEYACRGGTETDYGRGDGEAALAEVGWYGKNAGTSLQPVGKKEGNVWGLRDMHGNVWEWCEDVYDGKAYRKREDGWKARAWSVEDAGEDAAYVSDDDRALKRPFRVLRGGSWSSTAANCRAASRYWLRPSNRFRDIGFRVCLARRSAGPASQEEAESGDGGGRRGRRRKPEERGGAGPDLDLARERLPERPA